MNTEKKDEIQVINKSEVQVIPSKEELQIGMRKTLAELDEKLAKLEVPSEKAWKVPTFTFRVDGADISMTISTCNDLSQLVKALIMSRKALNDFNEIKKELNLPATLQCQVASQDVNVVIEELERRIKIITNTKQIADIKAAKTKLEAFLSEDDRLIKTLSEVESLLK